MLSLTIALFVAFLMLFLGVVVFVHNPRGQVNRRFFLWVAFIVAWMAFNYLENLSRFSLSVRAFFLRADFASGVLAAGFLLLFVLTFIRPKLSGRLQALVFLPSCILAVLSFTRWQLARIFLAPTGEIQFAEGPVFNAYALVVIICFILPCILLLLERHRALPAQRPQMTAIAVGLILTTVGSLTVNLFLQNVLSVEWFRLGIYSMLFFVIGVAWAIARHRFLQIRFVLIEILLLGILATLLARALVSKDWPEAAVNVGSFAIMLVLGFAMIRSFLNEERQRQELQALAQELTASNQRLRRLDDLKTTMVSIASHQIRGPLGGIRGYLTMFRDGDLGALTDSQKEIVTLNLNVTTRLLNAVETFLDITKLESGKITLRKEVLPFDEVIADVVEEFRLPFQKKHLELELAYVCPRPVLVEFDPEKIQHVIFNLIDNAMKYTEEGNVTVRLRCEKGEAIFEVADTGMGIPPGDAARLFGKFERGELTVDRGGSGLGLYVVKMLTEMQGGRVWASSPGVGRGSVFSVALPLARAFDPATARAVQ